MYGQSQKSLLVQHLARRWKQCIQAPHHIFSVETEVLVPDGVVEPRDGVVGAEVGLTPTEWGHVQSLLLVKVDEVVREASVIVLLQENLGL